jgi:hypothetical protein
MEVVMDKRIELGKIESVSYGICRDRGYLMGITFVLTFPGAGCISSKQVNMSKHTERCNWSIEDQNEQIVELMHYISGLLKDAKVDNIAALKNIPIEANFKNYNMLESFRILTEVL